MCYYDKDDQALGDTILFSVGCVAASMWTTVYYVWPFNADSGWGACVFFAVISSIVTIALTFYRLRKWQLYRKEELTNNKEEVTTRIQPGFKFRTLVALMLLAGFVGYQGKKLIPQVAKDFVISFLQN